jgi:hypothetical protein
MCSSTFGTPSSRSAAATAGAETAGPVSAARTAATGDRRPIRMKQGI